MKLNDAEIRKVQELLEQGIYQRDIAYRFSVAKSTIQSIKAGRIYPGKPSSIKYKYLDEQIVAWRQEFKDNPSLTIRSISVKYGVHYTTMQRILSGTRRPGLGPILSAQEKRARIGFARRKLNDEQVEEVRKLIHAKVPHAKIAEQFHVSTVYIDNISCGRRRVLPISRQ